MKGGTTVVAGNVTGDNSHQAETMTIDNRYGKDSMSLSAIEETAIKMVRSKGDDALQEKIWFELMPIIMQK
jgi:hypothetical protein